MMRERFGVLVRVGKGKPVSVSRLTLVTMLLALVAGVMPVNLYAADAGETPAEVIRPVTPDEGEAEAEAPTEGPLMIEAHALKGKFEPPYLECAVQLARAGEGFEVIDPFQLVEIREETSDPISRKRVMRADFTVDFPSLVEISEQVTDQPLPEDDPRMKDPYGRKHYSVDMKFRLIKDRSTFATGGDRLEVSARFYDKDTGKTLGVNRGNSDQVYTTKMLQEVMGNWRFPLIIGVESTEMYEKVANSDHPDVQKAFYDGTIDHASVVAANKKVVSPYEGQKIDIVCFATVRQEAEAISTEYRIDNMVFIFGREMPIKWDDFDFSAIDFGQLKRRAIRGAEEE